LRKYEELLLVKPDLDQEKIDLVLNKVKDQITQNKGEVIEAKLWKKARLAYNVQHYVEGVYLLVLFEMDAENLERLKRFCQLEQEILKFLIIKKE